MKHQLKRVVASWRQAFAGLQVPVTAVCFVGGAFAVLGLLCAALVPNSCARRRIQAEMATLREQVSAYREETLREQEWQKKHGASVTKRRRLKPEAQGAPQVTEYRIDIQVSRMAGRRIGIVADTNFPNGTRFHVTVERTYYETGDPDAYSGDISSEHIPVEDGKIETVVLVDDRVWLHEREKKKRGFQASGIWSELDRVSPDITVSMLYTPARPQPRGAQAILGRYGEYVGGDGAEKVMRFTVFRAKESIGMPYSPG